MKMFQITQWVGKVFDDCWPIVERCLMEEEKSWVRDFTPREVYAGVKAGLLQLWAFGDEESVKLILLTDVLRGPARVILRVRWAYGTGLFAELFDIVEMFLQKYATTMQAQTIQFEGSFAMYRMVKKKGAEPISVKFSVPVRHDARN